MVKVISSTLSANLKGLMADVKYGLESQPKVASKAKVGQRTVGRALKGEVSITVGSLEGLAHAFGIAPWQLLHPTLGRMPGTDPNDPLLFQLINFWGQLSQESRDKILAEANWHHSQEHPHVTNSNPYPTAQRLLPTGARAKSKA